MRYPKYPYMGRSIGGSVESVQGITLERLQEFYTDKYGYQNALCIVTSRLPHEKVVALIGALSPSQTAVSKPYEPMETHVVDFIQEAVRHPSVKTLERQLCLPYPGNLPASEVRKLRRIANLLTEGPYGTLLQELRIKRNWVYGTPYTLCEDPLPAIYFPLRTEPKHFDEAESIFRSELAKIAMGDINPHAFAYLQNRWRIEHGERQHKKSNIISSIQEDWLCQRRLDDYDKAQWNERLCIDDLAQFARTHLLNAPIGRIDFLSEDAP